MADFITDVQSIQYLVSSSKTIEEAKSLFYVMQGVDLDREIAEKVFEEMLKVKFSNKNIKAQISKMESKLR
jgi:hypothetical protein